MQPDYSKKRPLFTASEYLERIRKAYTSLDAAIHDTWDDGYWKPDDPIYNVTTKSFNIARSIRRAVLALGGHIISISPEYMCFIDLDPSGNDRIEHHAVIWLWFALDGDE